MGCINCPFHGGQCVEGFTRQAVIVCEEGGEKIPGPGTALAALRPAYPNLVIPSIQKNFDIWAALAGCFLESALAPVLEPVQRCLNMFAGAQTVDAVVGTVAAVDGVRKRANLHTIGLSAAGVGPVDTEKDIIRRL